MHLGYAINKPKTSHKLMAPYKIKNNKGKLDPSETQTLAYFINNIDSLIDFSDFDNQQATKNKQPRLSPANTGLISTGYRHPTHTEIFSYVKFSRDKYIHTSKKLPEFRGLTNEIMDLLDFMVRRTCKKSLTNLSDLKEISV